MFSGKEFDIFKVLELAKAHRNITTERPPCIVDEDDNLCTTKKENGEKYNHKMSTQPPKETAPGAHALAFESILTTRLPVGQPGVEKRTELPPLKIPTPNPVSNGTCFF